MSAHQIILEQVQGHAGTAMALLMGGMVFAPPYPSNWGELTDLCLDAEVAHLADAELYVLSPQMCDVVVAAAQSLTFDDLALITADDLPGLSGIVVLPHPVLVRAITGGLADDRAYTWRAVPNTLHVTASGVEFVPGVRVSTYEDTYGPVQPDSFRDMAARAATAGTPLPPWLLDAMRCQPYEFVATDEQRAALDEYMARARRIGAQGRANSAELGFDEDRVVGEYQPGQEIPDADGRFTERFLYAFWRLCDQRIATVTDAPITHSAQLLAHRATVPPEVRVVDVRRPDDTADDTAGVGRDWQHRWVVRMHKVRQWYPTEQRHKVIYRGPYIKGPADKPLLGGETVRGVTL